MILTLLVLAGLTAGTFYPLTLSFVLRNFPMRYVLIGIAMFAMDIIFTTNFATALEAWYIDHLSWRWIFWNAAALTPVMMVLVYFGIPWQPLPQPKEGQPKPNWRGFLYASLGFSLLYIALDQGQRLDWLNSGTVVGLIVSGVFLLLATVVRRLVMPNHSSTSSFWYDETRSCLEGCSSSFALSCWRRLSYPKLPRNHQGIFCRFKPGQCCSGWLCPVSLRPTCDLPPKVHRRTAHLDGRICSGRDRMPDECKSVFSLVRQQFLNLANDHGDRVCTFLQCHGRSDHP